MWSYGHFKADPGQVPHPSQGPHSRAHPGVFCSSYRIDSRKRQGRGAVIVIEGPWKTEVVLVVQWLTIPLKGEHLTHSSRPPRSPEKRLQKDLLPGNPHRGLLSVPLELASEARPQDLTHVSICRESRFDKWMDAKEGGRKECGGGGEKRSEECKPSVMKPVVEMKGKNRSKKIGINGKLLEHYGIPYSNLKKG
jgi:hypothetical protein